jgi:putative membrane protein
MRYCIFYMALVALFFTACTNKNNSDSSTVTTTVDTTSHTTDTSSMSNNAAPDKSMQEDSAFLATAHQVGTFEIEAAKLAQKKSQNGDVKDFARMMATDHTAMGKDVEALAQKENIMLPLGMGDDNQKEWDKLNSLTGSSFDKEYADVNVKGHKDAISKFEKTSQDKLCSMDVQKLASDALPKLKTHKEHADMLKGNMKM